MLTKMTGCQRRREDKHTFTSFRKRKMAPLTSVMAAALALSCFAVQVVLVDSKYECSTIENNASINCSCRIGYRGSTDLDCPQDEPQNTLIQAHINIYGDIDLQCSRNNFEDFNYFSGLTIGPTRKFTIKFCPLPNSSILTLMTTMGIPKTDQIEMVHGNYTNMLQRKHFERQSNVTDLSLNSDNLTDVPEDLFQDMINLTSLNLRDNNLINMPKEIFKYNFKLNVLELGSNKLANLEPGIFRNLTRLRLLNLWGNKLTELRRGVFTDIPNLETLDLSSNLLVTLNPDLFLDLGNLKVINLSTNDFEALPQGLFSSNQALDHFNMKQNRKFLKTLPPKFLSDLKQLTTVSIRDCNISNIPQDVFWGSSAITTIVLKNNALKELHSELFRDNTELRMIDLSNNFLTTLPDGLFSNTKSLTKLLASRNHLTSISGKLFADAMKLEFLDLSSNKLMDIHTTAFINTHNLQTVQMSNNFLTLLNHQLIPNEVLSPFQYCLKMKTLNLRNNSITDIFGDWLLSLYSLKELDLSYNKISYIKIYDLHFIVNDTLKVDLSYNNISEINFRDAEGLALLQYNKSDMRPLENKSVKVQLSGNPLNCDCRIYDLIRYFRYTVTPEVHYLVDIDAENLKCAGPEHMIGMYAKDLKTEWLTCPLNRLMNISNKTCPAKCHCFYRPADQCLLINCSNADLKSLHEQFLLHTYYDVYMMPLSPIHHTELYLNNNKLKSLPKVLDAGFRKVTKLVLNSNNLTYINVSALSPNLTDLELDNNRITSFDSDSINFLQQSETLKKLSLQNNPWKCNCDARKMLEFIVAKFKQVEMNNVTCSDGRLLSSMGINEICPSNIAGIISLSVFIAVLGFLIGLLAALYYKYQQEVKVWLYAHQLCLWFVTEEELDKDKIYDAFISYSHQDEEFIVNHLVPELENGAKPFKLCLHYRDWIVGDWIPNQIARSVEDSRRTIVILSPNFLESVWGKMEFRMAHKRALDEGRARVIIILHKDVGSIDNLDPELKAYISMNTYLKWGDPWFWDKLRYALPHPPEFSKGIPMISRSSSKQQNTSRPILDLDKADLMKGSDPNASPPATTTPPAESYLNAIPSLIPNGTAKIECETKHSAKVQY